MSTRKKWFLGFFLILAIAALFVSMRTQKGEAADRRDVPSFGVPGPHSVGKRDLVTEGERPLPMIIWYPTAPDNDEEAAVSPYKVKLGAPLGEVTLASTAGQAIHNAPYDRSAGPYPLVILSPGFAIGGASYSWLAEHLASYGFVVIAPEHQETLDPQNELWRAAIIRPQDILAVFAYLDEQTGPGGALDGLIDGEETAVIGHSYGGYTALAAAGAQIDTTSFKSHCTEAIQTEDSTAWLCDMLLPHLAEMADLAGLDAVPEGLWPPAADPRVDAIVAMAGDAYFFGQPGLAKIDVPVLAMGGTLDEDTPFLWGPQPTYEHTVSPRKAQIALNDAEHMIFTNTCQSIRWYAKPLASEFCDDSVWDRDQAHDLVKHFTTAFLLAELKHDSDAAVVLIPNAVEFPNVTYKAQGY
jgi:predicted dienelactone hydrolase